MKYFLLGAFSSGFFLYGSAMLYGFAGTVDLGGISDAVTANAGQNGLLVAGMALISVGLIYSYRAQVKEYQYLLYGVGGLFLMGLALRAIYLA